MSSNALRRKDNHMGTNDYESELYPIGQDPQDFDWGKAFLLGSSTDNLKNEYDRLVEQLKKLRDNEPPKKRGQKSAYRSWVCQTHDLLDLLNEIAEELRSRKSGGTGSCE